MNIATFLDAFEFAADKHRGQLRKNAEGSPYINHLIAVTRILAQEGGVTDESMLIAAMLHDTVEDTDTTFEELEAQFGAMVAGLVREMTDDKKLDKAERKRLQIVHAPHCSPPAKQLKIADKIANIRDITNTPPATWSLDRKLEDIEWAGKVVAGCRGVNVKLDDAFDEAVRQGRAKVSR